MLIEAYHWHKDKISKKDETIQHQQTQEVMEKINKYVEETHQDVKQMRESLSFVPQLELVFKKYKNKDFFKALEDINKIIEKKENDPKSHLLRAFIISEIYQLFAFIPGMPPDEVRDKYFEEWYAQAVEDFRKVIILVKRKDDEIIIDAKLGLIYLDAESALLGLHKDNGGILLQEAKKKINKLLEQFPNSKKITTYSSFIDEYISIHRESESIFANISIK